MKKIAIIGSTGSIGKNTIEVIKSHPQEFSIHALAAKNNADELIAQAKEFSPEKVVIFDPLKLDQVKSKLNSISVTSGMPGLIDAVTDPAVDIVLLAVTGADGLEPLIAAIRAKKNVALANKEPLVMAGQIIRKLASEYGVQVIPIDSEHSGIFQLLEGRPSNKISRVYLTASGGPFLNRPVETFSRITPEEAVQHPRWIMGKKISVDSATLMNKGLEVIEASGLFGLGMDQIHVLIHPEAVVHAIIEFEDGSQLAQLSVTDMKLPIQYALSYPKRLKSENMRLSLEKTGTLNFQKADMNKFPCLALAYQAGRAGGTAPCVLNAANEICVESFLKGDILFTEISKLIGEVLSQHTVIQHPGLNDIFQSDAWARNRTREFINTKVSA